MEEMNAEVLSAKHLYTTDFFQPSAFNKDDQVLSIYYTAVVRSPEDIAVVDKPFDFREGELVFRWENLNNISASDLTFPIDRVVLDKIS